MRHVVRVATLLFFSGACALIYQTVWLRQFRLIFGASTLASAAVLAIFMGGLGAGGIVVGRRVDSSRNPLALYGLLELGVAAFAGATPLFLAAVRAVYLAAGGSFGMGSFLATIVRLLLSVLVLGIPTFLMGGTLPAAARSVESAGDAGRRALATIYATNTLGAVAGTLLSTFFLLERVGNRKTLWLAALLNVFLALTALLISNLLRAPKGRSHQRRDEIESDPAPAPEERTAAASPRFVFAAAAITGFAFLLMELVWYRMLAPLLGGTTFTFGLILAAALLGIGGGSFAYATLRRGRATTRAFAITCALEALLIAVPFALGDRVAVLALLLRSLGATGFGGFVLSWSIVAAIVVLPAAFISGIQFPILISLLGEGREAVGRHVGVAYAWNTAGAIAGSLFGGFGALPLLTAPGTWRAVVIVLAALAVVSAFSFRSWLIAAAAIAMLFATGPTAFWRHTPIGAGRAEVPKTRSRLIDLEHQRRRTTVWEAEGIESSVSVSNDDGYAFIVNGKGDGHARLDGGTQVMGGVLAGLLHPRPKRAVVIGLGTGTTAGWLASLPSIERVDAVEIEPAIVHVAEMCTPVNRGVLQNPKAHVVIGDGRDFLLSRGDKYDVISSEPSNPYRAGIANLFTTEFYEACLSRLADGGVFIQFLQAYEVDAPTVRTIYGTISAVFPHVETWQTQAGDLLLVGARDPLAYDVAAIRARMGVPAVAEAVRNVWWAHDAESVLAHYVCGTSTAKMLGAGAAHNTDDRPLVEYAFARTLGAFDAFDVAELRQFARTHADDVPPGLRNAPERAAIDLRRLSIGIPHESRPDIHSLLPEEMRLRAITQLRYVEGAYPDVWMLWHGQKQGPETPLEVLTYVEALADRGDESAMPYLQQLHGFAPIETEALLARLRWRQGRREEAVAAMTAAFSAYRTNPWPLPVVMRRAIMFVNEISAQREFAPFGPRIFDALAEPFAIDMFDELRRSTLLLVANRLSPDRCSPRQLALVQLYEPNVPWQPPFLHARARCYEETGDPRAEQAAKDLRELLSHEPVRLEGGPR